MRRFFSLAVFFSVCFMLSGCPKRHQLITPSPTSSGPTPLATTGPSLSLPPNFKKLSYQVRGVAIQPGVFTLHVGTIPYQIALSSGITPGQAAFLISTRLSSAGLNTNSFGNIFNISLPTSFPPPVATFNIPGISVSSSTLDVSDSYPAELSYCPYKHQGEREEDYEFPVEKKKPGNPPPDPCQEPYRGELQLGCSLMAQSGEFAYQQSPLRIKGRGMGFDVTFTYRSRSKARSFALGPGWSHNWERRLTRTPDQHLILSNGYGRTDQFDWQGPSDPTNYADGPGVYKMVNEEYPWAYVRDRFGTTEKYFLPNGLLDSVTDKNGNWISVRYSTGCNVGAVIDTMGRVIKYHNAMVPVMGEHEKEEDEEKLVSITDFTGREIKLDYCPSRSSHCTTGDLLSITGPAVLDSESALNSNGFSGGKTTHFAYDTTHCPMGNPRCGYEDLRHNLLTVTEEGETAPSIRNEYGRNYFDRNEFDRVLWQECGSSGLTGTNRWSRYSYQPPPSDPAACRDIATTEINADGFKTEYFTDRFGHLKYKKAFTGRHASGRNVLPGPGLPHHKDGIGRHIDFYLTDYHHNYDGEITSVAYHDGRQEFHEFYKPNPNTDRVERLKRGNRLRTVRKPGPRGADQFELVENWTYEPVFNQVKTHTSPRGANSLPPGDFQTTYIYDWEQGPLQPSVKVKDANGNQAIDASPYEVLEGGNVVRIVHPVENPLNPAPEEQFSYNEFGQEVLHTDQELNRHRTSHYAEINPSGLLPTPAPPDGRILSGVTGGYVKEEIRDEYHPASANSHSGALPAHIVTKSQPDPLGREYEITNGRGVISRTRHNSLDQVWKIEEAGDLTTGAAAGLMPLRIEALHFYDARNRLVQTNHYLDNLDTPDEDSPGTPFQDDRYISTAYFYDHAGQKIEERSEVVPGKVRIQKFKYDSLGNLIHVDSPEAAAGNQPNNFVAITYDEFRRKFRVYEASGVANEQRVTESYYYQDTTSLIKEVDGRGNATSYQYDGYGRLVASLDALGGVREHRYDDDGNEIKTWFEGDPGPLPPGTILPSTSPARNVILSSEESEYDAENRKTRSKKKFFIREHPQAHQGQIILTQDGNRDGWIENTIIYDRLGRPVTAINDKGFRTETYYDGIGRGIMAVDAMQNRIKTEYDESNNPQTITAIEILPGLSLAPRTTTYTTRNGYDAANRRIKTVDNAGGVSFVKYDSLGQVTEKYDAEGNTNKNYYDALSRIIKTETILTQSGKGPGGGLPGTPDISQGGGDGLITVKMQYDLNSRVTGRTDDNGKITVYTYNNRNLLKSETYPDGSVVRYSLYDGNGNLKEKVDANGTLVKQDFDELNRLTLVSGTPASGNPFGVQGTTVQSFQYDGLSRMGLAADNNGATGILRAGDRSHVYYTYDSPSSVYREDQRMGGIALFSPGSPLITGAEHDGEGNPIRLLYSKTGYINFEYDALNRIQNIRLPRLPLPLTLYSYTYQGPDLVKTRTAPQVPGMPSLEMEYDLLKRPVSISHQSNLSGAISKFTYGYDKIGNRIFERYLNNQGKNFHYDSVYQLRRTDEGAIDNQGFISNLVKQEAIRYDGVGNRLEKDKSGQRIDYRPNELNQYTQLNGVNYQYDKNGNLTDNGEFLFAYDFLNRLRTVTSKATSQVISKYWYDGRGRQIKREESDRSGAVKVTRSAYSGDRVLEEVNASNQAAASYIYGERLDEVLRKTDHTTQPPKHYYFHEDALGSIAAVTDAQNGGILERYQYESFGVPSYGSPNGTVLNNSAIGNDILFAGKRYEESVKLYNNRARYYSPELGRFLQRDPAGYQEGMNLYWYGKNNPTTYVDLDGKIIETLWDIANVGMGLVSAGSNLWAGNFGAAAVDLGGVVLDAASVALPGVPGGAGTAIKAARAADKAVDAVKALNKVDNAVDAVKAADKVSDAAKTINKVDNVHDASKTADAAGDAQKIANKSAVEDVAKAGQDASEKITESGARGRNFEKVVSEQTGNIKNTELLKTSEGVSIPDSIKGSRFTEIKDVKSLSLDKQFRSHLKGAADYGVPFDLIVSPRTKYISNPLQEAIKKSGGSISVFDPHQIYPLFPWVPK